MSKFEPPMALTVPNSFTCSTADVYKVCATTTMPTSTPRKTVMPMFIPRPVETTQ